jgi:hypothetical protein
MLKRPPLNFVKKGSPTQVARMGFRFRKRMNARQKAFRLLSTLFTGEVSRAVPGDRGYNPRADRCSRIKA